MIRKNKDQVALKEILEELNLPVRPGEIFRHIELCQRALELISKETHTELWGSLQDDLGSSLAQTPTGVRAENLEQAIRHFEQALEVGTRQRCPEEWASTLNNLATVYRDRIRGDRAKNIEQAICYYQQALERPR